MSNKKNEETEKKVENSGIKINETDRDKVIQELKAQIALLTDMITSQSKRNEEAEKAFFKKKTIIFNITTFREPTKTPDVKEIKIQS